LVDRKTAFLEQVASANLGGGQSGGSEAGGSSAGSGGNGALSGGSTTQGLILQVAIVLSIIASTLTAAYIFRDQINDQLTGKSDERVEQSGALPIETPLPALDLPATEPPIADHPATEPPVAEEPRTGDLPKTASTPEAPSNMDDMVDDPKDKIKSNQGLHLGQTPGPPNTPAKSGACRPLIPEHAVH